MYIHEAICLRMCICMNHSVNTWLPDPWKPSEPDRISEWPGAEADLVAQVKASTFRERASRCGTRLIQIIRIAPDPTELLDGEGLRCISRHELTLAMTMDLCL